MAFMHACVMASQMTTHHAPGARKGVDPHDAALVPHLLPLPLRSHTRTMVPQLVLRSTTSLALLVPAPEGQSAGA